MQMQWSMASWSVVVLALIISSASTTMAAKSINSTKVLSKFDNLSTFNKYLSDTGVVKEVDGRSSLTVLAISNSVLDPVIASVGPSNLLVIADILRYHCLLQYLEISEIRSMTNSTGILLTTLLQTTGRAVDQAGFLNISVSRTGAIHLSSPASPASNSTIVKSLSQHPYDMSYLEVDRVLLPSNIGLQQGSASSRLANLTSTLKSRGNFNTFLGLISSTGVDSALKSISAVTLLVPTDDAFRALPPNALASLKQQEKIALLQFHAIPTYFTMGSLGAVTTPLPTLASAVSGGYSLNVSTSSDKAVSFVTGLNRAEVVDTEMDDPPVAVYSINRVLLPREIFGLAQGPAPAAGPAGAPGPAPVSAPVPAATPAPAPAPGPATSSPAPAPAPGPASSSPVPVPVPAPAASPPAPPAGGEEPAGAPEVAPATAPPSGAPRGVCGGVVVVAAAAAVLFL